MALVSAWNDSGGGFLARLLDSHPRAAVWPFELQLGTAHRHDAWSGVIHAQYRWPFFPSVTDPAALFDMIIDKELKSTLTGVAPPKFDRFKVEVDLERWRRRFCGTDLGHYNRRRMVAAYIDSFFAELNGPNSASDVAVGHCPCVIVDTDEILADFADARIIHLVRDPVAGLADFRLRHAGFDARTFADRWIKVNGAAARACERWPSSVLLIRFEDLLKDRLTVMPAVLNHLGLPHDAVVLSPTWLGRAVDENAMGPFGGIAAVSLDHERDAVSSIPKDEARILRSLADETQALLNLCMNATRA
ncbi:MAG: sulfotransferase [Alphaproteobacteria bacterium]|nr:sulfotransferase [Alphaproteobacteria bacterium]